MDPPFLGRSVTRDGRRGWVIQEHIHGGVWLKAIVFYETGRGMGDVINTVEEMQAILDLEDGDEDLMTELSPDGTETTEMCRDLDSPCGDLNECRKSSTGIALPPRGDSNVYFIMGPTGRWYDKGTCISNGDEKLEDWIDRQYALNACWHTERVVDQRLRDDGQTEYLVKFTGYELNPGVEGDETNPGDWYTESDNVDKDQLEEFRNRMRSRSGSSSNS